MYFHHLKELRFLKVKTLLTGNLRLNDNPLFLRCMRESHQRVQPTLSMEKKSAYYQKTFQEFDNFRANAFHSVLMVYN